MLSIDEAIAHAREVASRKFDDRVHCIRCAEEHEQLAEWLEELKAYREIGTVEECKNSVLDIQKAYNKAIDDFVERLKTYLGIENATKYGNKNAEQMRNSYGTFMNYEIADSIEDVAEQLKERTEK